MSEEKLPNKNGIGGCRLGQPSQIRRGTRKNSYEIVSMKNTKRITQIHCWLATNQEPDTVQGVDPFQNEKEAERGEVGNVEAPASQKE
jgi:hypothetical protein